MPNAQNVLVHSRSICSTPVNGMTKAVAVEADCDCGLFDPEVPDAEDCVAGGGVLRATRTTKDVDTAVLPALSVALQVMTVSPTGKSDPETGEQDAAPDPSTASEVDGLV